MMWLLHGGFAVILLVAQLAVLGLIYYLHFHYFF